MAIAENLQPVCHWVINILFAIGEGSIILRIYTRGIATRTFGLDDWAMLPMLIFNIGQQAVLYLFMRWGGGRHINVVLAEDPTNLTHILKMLFAEEIYYIFMHFWIKLCFLLFYLRLSHTKSFRWMVYGAMILNGLNTTTIWLLYCLQCKPLQAFWNPTGYPEAKCLNAKVTYFVPGSLELFLDVIIFLIPMHTIFGLQMDLRRRIAVLAVITTGGAASVVSGLRLIIVNQFATNPDVTYVLGRMILISAVEIQVAIFAANMPAMKAFWLLWRKGSLTSNGRSQPSKDGPSQGTSSHQLSTFWSKRKNTHQKIEDSKTSIDIDGRDGSTRHLTLRGSDDELTNAKGNQITVSTEYTVSDELGPEVPTGNNNPFAYHPGGGRRDRDREMY